MLDFNLNSAPTYFAADGDHELRNSVTVINHQCFHRTIEHLHSQDSMFLLVLQQILTNQRYSVGTVSKLSLAVGFGKL